MTSVLFLLDGDSTRRLIKRKLGKNPTAAHVEAFCKGTLHTDEMPLEAYYYDCAPFGETRTLPVSNTPIDFKQQLVYKLAVKFQSDLSQNPFFRLRRGYLSFDGWTIKDSSIQELIKVPRILTDADFEPMLSQKQVDMKIALDVAKVALGGLSDKILMVTCDSDFIPMVDFAKSKGVEVDLILDRVSLMKRKLKKVFTDLRYV